MFCFFPKLLLNNATLYKAYIINLTRLLHVSKKFVRAEKKSRRGEKTGEAYHANIGLFILWKMQQLQKQDISLQLENVCNSGNQQLDERGKGKKAENERRKEGVGDRPLCCILCFTEALHLFRHFICRDTTRFKSSRLERPLRVCMFFCVHRKTEFATI